MRNVLFSAMCITGLFLTASATEREKVVQSSYGCPLDGCTLECIVDNRKPIVITGIKQIKMTAYRDIGTFYALDMGMEGKRTVIIDGDTVLCQILDHK